jgi:hypothetical protein
VASSIHHNRVSSEVSIASSGDGNELNALEINSDAQTVFGRGSSSSVNASMTDASIRPLTLKPPAWLESPLMPYSGWNIKFEELRIGVRVGIGEYKTVSKLVLRRS